MLLVKAVRKEKAPNPGDCHGIGGFFVGYAFIC